MSFSRILLAAAAVACLAGSASAQTPAENAAQSPPPAGGGMGGGGHGMMRGMFTPEERMMLMVDMHKATANMTDDQKQAYRKQQRQQFMAMSDADRAKYKADLDTRWAALPPDQKAAIQQRMQDFMAKRAQGDGGGQ
jgi:Spy/CpxP family protein refolding chaperone